MSRRSPPPTARPGVPSRQTPVEPAPFIPVEPWWRQSRRGSGGKRGQDESPPRFQTVASRVAEREEVPTPAGRRVSGAAVAALVVALALFGGVGFLVTTDWLAVTRTTTEIHGAQRLPEDAIYAASQLEGVNIFQMHPGRVAERIRQTPGIAEVAVHPRLPYQVTIVIREETPFVIWQGITTTTWLAENGAIVPAIGAPPSLKLTDLARAAPESAGKLQAQVLADLKALRAAGLEETELYYGAQEGLYFRSADGWTVYLGNDGQMATKLAALRTIKTSKAAQSARARIVDLRAKGHAQVW
jgi:cell division septal protein FtsQ